MKEGPFQNHSEHEEGCDVASVKGSGDKVGDIHRANSHIAPLYIAGLRPTFPLYFSVPHRFCLESGNSARFRRNGTGIRRNDRTPAEWHWNDTGIRLKGL